MNQNCFVNPLLLKITCRCNSIEVFGLSNVIYKRQVQKICKLERDCIKRDHKAYHMHEMLYRALAYDPT